ncbi:gamma-glutamyl-gamma-aminobutyrate hydrolase family protein [Shouchella clausii]|uniref:Gamma-glutamyl-gamma-aminobutyrate hydrolase n=1 Tax=Shouchella clausii TaxID=79880 RepID=A0A268NZ36_SHOCL|nr:gamma-glutamyl-gamma-aminobutyrate hydrolase family protein [Shouchella clausii]MDO7266647.1 gamma-glutamyl-gamma-aminobutyrate hydrolase family protein [Shouchella clausii]MDO7286438.1 gamma-glutamyl-gamma-aminobutyrate hydrolase family protein [Shouchella clausii]PAE88688.1 gamma-glutamyl-gamma-aminobutyrate hydrolase [Shouchella clausii]
MAKPVIGITSTIALHNQIPSVDLAEKVVKAVMNAGGVPIVLPVGNVELASDWITACHGLILSSGEDVDPYLYKAEPSPKLQKTFKQRDEVEMELVKQALQQKKPIFAICRGIGVLNVALGGSLMQDIETGLPNACKHYQEAGRTDVTHRIQIVKDSLLHQVIGSEEIRVNSLHHQAIGRLAPPLKQVASAADGVIEAVEGKAGMPYVLGVQWHPEELAANDAAMARLFTVLIERASEKSI